MHFATRKQCFESLLNHLANNFSTVNRQVTCHHSNIAVRARHIDPDAAYNLVLTGSIDGEVMAETVPWLSFRCNRSAEALQSTGSLLIWDAEPEELHGRVAQVHAQLYDPAQEDPDDSELALKVARSSTEYTIWDLNLE